MKKLSSIVMIGLLGTSLVFASDLTEADKKWSRVVEQMIAEGSKEISTPLPQRVEIAKKLAAKHGAKTTVVKTKNGYRILIHADSASGK